MLAAVVMHVLLLSEPKIEPAILALRLVKAAVIFAVVIILFRKRQRDPVAGLLSLALLCWTITSSVDFSSRDVLPLALDRIRFLLFALALLLFPDGEWRPPWSRHVAVASVGVTILGLLEALGVLPTRLFLPLAVACVLAALAALLECFRTAVSEMQRLQMKWVALGLMSGISFILAARAGDAFSHRLPILALPAAWEALFQTGIVVIAAGFLVSLLRYRLFDAETVISRSAAYAALTVAVLAVFAGTEATIENVGQSYLGMGLGNISAGLGAATAAVLLNPLHHAISHWVERRFQHDLAVLKSELPALLEDLSASLSPRDLSATVLPRILEATHATHAALLIDESVIATAGLEQRAARQRHDGSMTDVFPVRIALERPLAPSTGWLLLGPRPDGSILGKDDLEAVEAIIPPLRRAMITATAREALQSEYRAAHTQLAGQVATLQQRILALESRQSSAGSA